MSQPTTSPAPTSSPPKQQQQQEQPLGETNVERLDGESQSGAPPPTPVGAAPESTAPPPGQDPRRRRNSGRARKVYDPLLEAWYYNEINKRINEDAELFKNYQINPYTKKTLDYVTPKITERRKPIPKEPDCSGRCKCCGHNPNPPKALTHDEKLIVDAHKMVKRALDRSINPPKEKYCEPQTEAMRVGWFDPPPPPPKNLECLYIKTCWSDTPCCYFHPRQESEGVTQNEMYDERFRAVHRTADFIHTESKLRYFDSIMNPDGYRGKIKTERKRPSGLGSNLKK